MEHSSSLQDYMILLLSAMLIKNVLLAKFLGHCPFLGVSRRMETAVGMSMAVVFVMTMAGMITWVVRRFLLEPFDLTYMQTIAFILVIASLVQFVELFLQKTIPALYKALGIFLPLITTNCAVLGVALLNINENHDFIKTVVFSIASAIGYGLALILFAGLREKFEVSDIPKPFRGTAIGLITAGMMSMAFMGFAGLV